MNYLKNRTAIALCALAVLVPIGGLTSITTIIEWSSGVSYVIGATERFRRGWIDNGYLKQLTT